MRKLHVLTVLVCVAMLPALLRADTVVEEIVARVNNSIVTLSDYQRSKEQLKDEVKTQEAGGNADKTYAEREKDVLRDLIDQQLLLEKGKDLGITADTELIKKFYDEHRGDMEQPEQIRLSEILVAVQKPAPPPAAAPKTGPDAPPPSPAPLAPAASAVSEADQLAAAEAKAKGLADQIKKGVSFDEVAKKNSDGPTASQGGDLGLFKRGTLSKELEDKTFAMKAGETTDVIRTKQGFVILKVTEHQMAGIPSMKQMEPRIQDALYYQKLQPALRAYLKKLREEAYIDIRSGYVDSGASPNQTKPVETSGKEAAGKNLKSKKKKKFLVI